MTLDQDNRKLERLPAGSSEMQDVAEPAKISSGGPNDLEAMNMAITGEDGERGSYHPGGMQVARADGSVRYVMLQRRLIWVF